MGSTDRATNPQNFQDRASARLLTTPAPQLIHADMWLGAQRAELNLSVDDEHGVQHTQAGADYAAWDRDALMLATGITSVVATPMLNFSGAPGHTMKFPRPVYADTTYTQASRLIPTGQSISTDPISVGGEQVPLTVQRFGGPYDVANSRVAPFSLEMFEEQFGIHKQKTIIDQNLTRDYHKFIDAVQIQLLDSAASILYAGAATTDDTLGAAGANPFDLALIAAAETAADEASLPTFEDGYRVMVITPTQKNQLRADAEYSRLSENHKAYNFLFKGYVSTVHKTHLVCSNQLRRVTNASSAPVQYAQYLCPNSLFGGMGRAPGVRTSTDTNYGETQRLIWLSDLAFGLADDRYALSIRSN